MQRTRVDRPSAAPASLTIEVQSSTEVLISWEPPLSSFWNGNLTGFELIVVESESGTLRVNASLEVDEQSFLIESLRAGTEHNISLAATTEAGPGPAASRIARTSEAPASSSSESDSGSAGSSGALVVIVVLVVVVLVIILFVVMFVIVRTRRQDRTHPRIKELLLGRMRDGQT